MALYILDWDNLSRVQRVDILDANSNALLDRRNASSFTQGQYLIWNLKGHIKISISQSGGSNVVASGLFFGGASAPASGASATFMQVDTTTRGNWKNSYGSEGYNVIGDSASTPQYAEVAASGAQLYTWASSTAAPQALQKMSSSDRVAGVCIKPAVSPSTSI